MNATTMPPAWAETLLRLLLGRRDFVTVSGDLLEEYRESIQPSLGQGRADAWYVRQVFSFAWRRAWVWAALFALAFTGRTALDWFVPTSDYEFRAASTTFVAAAILLAAGFSAGSRSASFGAGPIVGFTTAALALPLKLAGLAALLAISHDANTLAAARDSGGLEEALTLPLLMLVPGFLLGAIGGLVGAAVASFRS